MHEIKSINFMSHKKLFFAISFLLIIPGLLSLIANGLRLSIDFTGGSLLSIKSERPLEREKFIAIGKDSSVDVISVQDTGDKSYILKTKEISQQQSDSYIKSLEKETGKITINSFESVGPTVGSELTRKALLAVAMASLCIVVYVAWSFRSIPKPYSSWKFGISAVVALIHDVFVVVGMFSIFGWLLNIEIDALFITALLTVIGFSVHDTIVVFDRVRENLIKNPKWSFTDTMNFSLTETLGRSINTSITVIITLLALLLFGGESIRWFVVALLVGIISGTFSSIFFASPILDIWENKK